MATRKSAGGKTARSSAGKSSARKSASGSRGARKTSSKRAGAKKSGAKTTAQKKVKRAMHERKTGKLRSCRSGKEVTSRKQAIAIGLSEARKAGGFLPARGDRRMARQ